MNPADPDKAMRNRLQEAERTAQKLAAEGRLLESGWSRLRETWPGPETAPEQVALLRVAYFAGAQHTWASVLLLMGEDSSKDMERVRQVRAELEAFRTEWSRQAPDAGDNRH